MSKTFLFSIIFLVFLSGCKTTKWFQSPESKLNMKHVVKGFEKNTVDYEWFKAKAKVRVTSKDFDYSGTLNLKMRNDSIIWGSVSVFLGIEVFRFFLINDTFVSIDRTKRQYTKIPINKVFKIIPIKNIDIKSIENIILGNVLFKIEDGFELHGKDSNYFLSKNENNTKIKIFFDPVLFNIKKYEFEENSTSNYALLEYSDERIEENKKSIPQNVDIKFHSYQKNSLYLKFNYVQFDKPFSINTTIPKGYEQLY